LDRPREYPSGENVKDRAGPASDTRESAGPPSDHRWEVDPRTRMLRVAGSTVRTSTWLPEIAMTRALVCAAAICPAAAATSMRSSAPTSGGRAIPKRSATSARTSITSISENPARMHQDGVEPAPDWHPFCASWYSNTRAASAFSPRPLCPMFPEVKLALPHSRTAGKGPELVYATAAVR
jgi:hypothetical protein